MKKTLLLVAAICSATIMSAQSGEITSNRGENWLSESGDWGITIHATPLLDYAGNLFNGNTGNSFGGWMFANPYMAIQGKMLVDSETAYRGKLRIGIGNDKSTSEVAGVADPTATFENSLKESYTAVVLGAGLEKRKGSTRIVGVYGGELLLGFGSEKDTYEYGEALSATNPGGPRPTETNYGGTFMIGLQAFGGVEWFCAPKVSISGEYTWGLALESAGYDETTTEAWNGTAVETTTSNVGSKDSSFSLDTGYSGVDIGVNFYFQ